MNTSKLAAIIINPKTTPEEKEDAVYGILQTLQVQQIPDFFAELPNYWHHISIARITKILRNVLSKAHKDENTLFLLDKLIAMYNDKKLLKLALQANRVEVLLETKKYNECIQASSQLYNELKKHGDKVNLINIHVFESKAFYELRNYSRAKSSLTQARALAVSTYCPVILQAKIDLQTGIYISDDGNYETAYSYFLEALDGFSMEKDPLAHKVISYLLLTKIINQKYSEVDTLLERYTEKLVMRRNTELKETENINLISVLLEIKKCCIDRDLKTYNILLNKHENMLCSDLFLHKHLTLLYNQLLEKNILKIIEPYCNIKIELIASLLNLNWSKVEDTMRKMILDGKIKGILDHEAQCLVLFDTESGEGDEKKFEILDALTELVRRDE